VRRDFLWELGGGRWELTILIVSALLVPPAARGQTASSSSSSPPSAKIVEQRLIDEARSQPQSVAAQHALASYYLQHGRIKAALPHLERAQSIDPTHYASGYDLAAALMEVGALDRARAQIKRMLAAKETGELYNLLGDVAERAGELTVAAEEYQRAAHMQPVEEHLFDWGNNLLQLRAYEPAAEVFTAAVKRHPRSARLHVGLGIAMYSQGQYSAAVMAFCDAADLAPKDPRPYQFLGEVYGVAPELAPEVTARLARFVKAQPGNALAHLYYALSVWKGERAASAPADLKLVELHLRRATALDPSIAKAFLELGILLADQQRHKEAIVPLQRAIRLAPDVAQAHYRLAQAYLRTGQRDLAAKELEIFQRLKDRGDQRKR
jgi:tetratricopeptide (TPR) repeat protein